MGGAEATHQGLGKQKAEGWIPGSQSQGSCWLCVSEALGKGGKGRGHAPTVRHRVAQILCTAAGSLLSVLCTQSKGKTEMLFKGTALRYPILIDVVCVPF